MSRKVITKVVQNRYDPTIQDIRVYSTNDSPDIGYSSTLFHGQFSIKSPYLVETIIEASQPSYNKFKNKIQAIKTIREMFPQHDLSLKEAKELVESLEYFI